MTKIKIILIADSSAWGFPKPLGREATSQSSEGAVEENLEIRRHTNPLQEGQVSTGALKDVFRHVASWNPANLEVLLSSIEIQIDEGSPFRFLDLGLNPRVCGQAFPYPLHLARLKLESNSDRMFVWNFGKLLLGSHRSSAEGLILREPLDDEETVLLGMSEWLFRSWQVSKSEFSNSFTIEFFLASSGKASGDRTLLPIERFNWHSPSEFLFFPLPIEKAVQSKKFPSWPQAVGEGFAEEKYAMELRRVYKTAKPDVEGLGFQYFEDTKTLSFLQGTIELFSRFSLRGFEGFRGTAISPNFKLRSEPLVIFDYQGVAQFLNDLPANAQTLVSVPESPRLPISLTLDFSIEREIDLFWRWKEPGTPDVVHLENEDDQESEPQISGFFGQGFTKDLLAAVLTFEKGLEVLYESQQSFAARNYRSFEFEKKFLKHRGVAIFALSEILHLKLFGQLSGVEAKMTEESALDWVLDQAQKIFIAKQKESQTQVKIKPLSEAFFAQMKIGLRTLLAPYQPETSLWSSTQQGPVTLQSPGLLQELLLWSILDSLIQTHGPKVFLKTQLKGIQLSNLNCSLRLSSLPKEESLGLVLCPQMFKDPWSLYSSLMLNSRKVGLDSNIKIDLLYEGRKLQTLGEDELTEDLEITSSKSDIDWFELNPQVYLKGERIRMNEIEFMRAQGVIHFRGDFYLISQKGLPRMKALMAFWERLKGNTLSKSSSQKESLRLPRSQALEMLALKHQGLKVIGDQAWKKVEDTFENLDSETFEEIECSEKLLSYQASGVRWMLKLADLHLGAVLADEMGLGKTAQVLSFLSTLKKRGDLGSCLIVVPTSLVYSWLQERDKFAPDLEIEVFGNGKAVQFDRGICLITYALMVHNRSLLEEKNFRLIVFDEAQYLKTRASQRTEVARSLKAKMKIALTGTPLENHYLEFFSIMDLVLPGSLGPLSQFRKAYFNSESEFFQENLAHLKLRVRPLLKRRTKDGVGLQLPAKTESKVVLELSGPQKQLYKKIAIQHNHEIWNLLDKKGESSAQLHMLAALTRLRQVCSNPQAIPGASYVGPNPKFDLIEEKVREIFESNESVLIFTQFYETLKNLEIRLRESTAGLGSIFTLHGSVLRNQREGILREFSESKSPGALIMTLKTGGVGLNLTKASYVLHMDPWWNPSAENQATDRSHRLGQNKPVTVYRLVMKDSIEENMEVLKARKQRLFEALMSDSESSSVKADEVTSGASLSKEDFGFLLGAVVNEGEVRPQ